MEPKEIKSSLKAAREAIRSKDFKEALKQCKAVIKLYKNNYNALVFIGVAAEGLDQLDQAVAAYKRAISVNADQILAWQGLCGLYEKHKKDEYQTDLIEVYNKLLVLYKSEDDKVYDITLKLANLHSVLGNVDEALEKLKSFEVQHLQIDKQISLLKNLIRILSAQKALSLENEKLLEETYLALVSMWKDPCDELCQTWTDYISLISQNVDDQEKLIAACKSMMSLFPDSPYPLEKLCTIYVDQFALGKTENIDHLITISKKLASVNSVSAILKLTDACMKMVNSDLIGAFPLLSEALTVLPDVVSCWVLLSRIQLLMHDRKRAENTITQGLQRLESKKRVLTSNSSDVRQRLKLYHMQVLSEGRHSSAINLAESMCQQMIQETGEGLDILHSLTEIYLKQGNLSGASEVIDKVAHLGGEENKVAALRGWYHFHLNDYKEAAQHLQIAIESSPNNSKWHYWLASVWWKWSRDDKTLGKNCFSTLLKAAKLDPYNSDIFLYLGYYYNSYLADSSKAKRCYQKAFDLDGENEDAGSALVDTLVALSEEEKASAILNQVTSEASAGRAKWAWLRLGLQQLRASDPTKAITSFQCALRADPLDPHCWECLGEGYMIRGSFTAAIKAFSRAVELNPDSLYCLYQIASIKQTLGIYSEAVVDYRKILDNTPSYVPALIGIGETHLHLLNAGLKQCFVGRAVDHAQSAIHYLTKAASGRPDLSSIWKLLGDSCTVLHLLDDALVKVNVPVKLMNKQDKTIDGDMCLLRKTELLALGARCYGRALKILPDCSSLWHDLGINYFRQAQNSNDSSAVDEMSTKAVQVLKKAISVDPHNHFHWNALGTVAASKCVSNNALAQHCFIKSTQLESNNVSAWTNLGTLYLVNQNIKLAHECFKTAQSLDPSYVASWIGQAIIAETVGHEEAMDLFRHTTELSNHIESSLGYGHWVCSILDNPVSKDSEHFQYSIIQMAALPAACDGLEKYTNCIQDNYIAYNIFGLLLEKQGLYRKAETAFSEAVKLLEGEAQNEHLNKVRANYARLLNCNKKYEEAIDQFKAIAPLQGFEEITGLALAYYNLGYLKESYQAYEQALQLAPTDIDRSNVYAALGLVAYKFEDVEGAKTELFKCSQMSPPSVRGLFSLCALGLLQQDLNLALAVVQELDKFSHSSQHGVTVCFLTSVSYIIQGDKTSARNAIVKAIHRNPASGALWTLLANHLYLHGCEENSNTSALCYLLAIANGDGDANLPGLLAMTSVGCGNLPHSWADKSGYRLSQKAIHLHPGKLENWFGLLAATHAESFAGTLVKNNTSLNRMELSLSSHLLSEVEKEQDAVDKINPRLQKLHIWSAAMYVISLLGSGRQEQSQQFLVQAVKLFASSQLLHSLLAFLERNVVALKSSASLRDSASSNMLVELMLKENQEESLALLQQRLGEVRCKQQIYLQLAHLAFRQIKVKAGNLDEWKKIFSDVVNEVLLVDPFCSTAYLLQGYVALEENNQRLAKRCFEKVLLAPKYEVMTWERRLARRNLVPIYRAKDDQGSIDVLIEAAVLENDEDFLAFCKK